MGGEILALAGLGVGGLAATSRHEQRSLESDERNAREEAQRRLKKKTEGAKRARAFIRRRELARFSRGGTNLNDSILKPTKTLGNTDTLSGS